MKRFHIIALAGANLLLPLSLIVFASGFFPHKPFLPGLAQYQDLGNAEPPPAPFDKVIFMVIDALRSDFVYSHNSGFQYTQSLIRNGFAMPFTSHARAPTVTMPRVKALTTGSIPSFLDMILNIAESDTSSTLASQDTWIAQMKVKGTGKLTMYGDDTWLRLFPNTFDRADGTTSFFVSDFTEVDNNVTRHVPWQLAQRDWSLMIMHYLGMDHIGHKSGFAGANMLPKQQEMDSIIEYIFENIQSQPYLSNTLLVLCGDHGMTDGGNHGGSTPGETSPAMVFMSPKISAISEGIQSPAKPHRDLEYYEVIEQSDVAPTLAGLLGIPVPLNNLGVFIPQLLRIFKSEEAQIQLLYRNALQMLEIVKETFPHELYTSGEFHGQCENPPSTADKLACIWSDAKARLDTRPWSVEKCQTPLLKFCYKAQESLSSIASNYDAARLYAGISLAFISVVLSAPLLLQGSNRLKLGFADVYQALISVIFVAMMFASSYVEEEQQFWYWVSAAWASISCFSTLSLPSLIILASLRLLRRWNQSGQKFAGSPDIALLLRSHPLMLALLCVAAYGFLFNNLKTVFRPGRSPQNRRSWLRRSSAWLQAISIIAPLVIFKLMFTFNDAPELFGDSSDIFRTLNANPLFGDLIQLTRTVWIACAIALVPALFSSHLPKTQRRHALASILTVFLANQLRATNVPTLLLFEAIWYGLASTQKPNSAEIGLWTLLLAHVSFFAMGGTNGISSIDLSNAYNGISGYNPLPVGILLFASNWAGPIYFSVMGLFAQLDSGNTVVKNVATSDGKSQNPAGSMNARQDGDSVKADPATFTTAQDRAVESTTPTHADESEINGKWHIYLTHISRLTSFMTLAVLGVEAACCALREHLFVWTVFSPKFLYVGAWVGGWHLCVNVVLGAVLVGLFG